MRELLLCVLFGLLVLNISACGFGGFDGTSASQSSAEPAVKPTKIKGAVAKGLFDSGYVEIFALNADGSTVRLNTVAINAFGRYSGSIGATRPTSGSSNGTVLLSASGSYRDEATGEELTIPSSTPLRAAVPNATGDVNASVTPLTELAVRSLGMTPTSDAVNSANALVSDIFKCDVVSTVPVDLSSTVFGFTGTSQSQKDYSLALAAVSQMIKDRGGSVATFLDDIASELASGSLSSTTAAEFKKALAAFLVSEKNTTGMTDVTLTNLSQAGGASRPIKIRTVGSLDPGVRLNGYELSMELPYYASVRADFRDPDKIIPYAGTVTSSGVASAGGRLVARFTRVENGQAAQIHISDATDSGYGIGEFVTVKVDIAAGVTPRASDFRITRFVAYDGNGSGLPQTIVDAEVFVE